MCVRTQHKHTRAHTHKHMHTHTQRTRQEWPPSESTQRAQGPAGRPQHRGSPRERRRQSEASGETAENGARQAWRLRDYPEGHQGTSGHHGPRDTGRA